MWWPRLGESARPGGGPEGGPRAGAPPPEGEPPDRFPSPPPVAAAQMRSPFDWWPSGSGGSRETQPAGDYWGRQEGRRRRLARGAAAAAARPASGDLLGWDATAAAAAGARGPPIDPRPERSGAMGAWGSHPTLEAAAAAAARPFVAPRSLQGGDAPSAPAAPFWDPQQDWDEGPSNRPTSSTEKTCSFEEQLQGLRRSSDPLAQELARALETVGRFALHLFSEHQQLKSRLHSLETQHRDRVSYLLAENNRLQQEIQEMESSLEASQSPPTGPQRSAPQPSPPKGQETPGKVFPMQIRTAGKTGGCERLFLNDVSRLLSRQGVSLKVEEYTETSEHPLLMFCPIASRLDTDIESAFQVLSGKQKVLLVVMHYAHKEQSGPFRQQATTHPSVVVTVHTRFTVLEGMYACEMNKAAVADVADTIKSLADDP